MSRCEVALAVGLIVVQSLAVGSSLLVTFLCVVMRILHVDARSAGMGCGEGLEEEMGTLCCGS